MRAVIYTRVSTQDQKDSRLGLESQMEICRTYAERKGYTLISLPVSDEGVSASIPLLDRPKGALFKTGSDFAILALCQDRIFRSVADMLVTCEILTEANITIETVDEGPIDLEDDDRWLAAMMRAVFAELERRRGRKRTVRGMAALKARGGRCGEPPYGWRKTDVKATFEEDADEQNVIRRVLLLSDEGLSSRDVAARLNGNGVRTRDGKDFSHTQILRILGRAENEGE